jgi:hypothetical protein
VLATFALIWSAASWFAAGAAAGQAERAWAFVKTQGVMVALWVVVVAIVRAGRSRTDVVVEGARLTFIKTGVFGTRRYSYAASDVAKIEIVQSGSAEEQPEYKLQIEPTAGTQASLSPRKELEWLGSILTQLGDEQELRSLGEVLQEELREKGSETSP